jgi:hypothetical protein
MVVKGLGPGGASMVELCAGRYGNRMVLPCPKPDVFEVEFGCAPSFVGMVVSSFTFVNEIEEGNDA